MTLGQNIARLRAQKNLSQGDLADALEVSRQSVSKWETDASIPELDKLLRLAELFGVTLDELVKGESAQPETARGEAPDKESAGAYTAAAPQARRETRQIVGTILLCFGALIAILIMLFAGTLAGFILALPLFVWRHHLPDDQAPHGPLVRVGAVSDGRAVSALCRRCCRRKYLPDIFAPDPSESNAPCDELVGRTGTARAGRLYAALLPRADAPLGEKEHCAAHHRLACAARHPSGACALGAVHRECRTRQPNGLHLEARAERYARFAQ